MPLSTSTLMAQFPEVSSGVLGIVVLAGLLHAAWNAGAHAIPDRLAGQVLMAVAATALSIPLVCVSPLPTATAWVFIAVSAVVHVLYGLCLMRSYDVGDFGQTYPVARATSPLLVVVVCTTVLGQHLGTGGWLGLGLLCAGIGLVATGGRRHTAYSRAAIFSAILTGFCIAAYTLVDAQGVRHGTSPIGYVAWIFVLQGPLAVLVMAARRTPTQFLADCRPHLVVGLLSGAVSLLAYGAVIWAQAHAPGNTSVIAATREIGIVFAALIGRYAFHEPLGVKRSGGAAMAFIGIAILSSYATS